MRVANGRRMHQVCESVAELAEVVTRCDAAGLDTYHACASYREPHVTIVENGVERKRTRVQRNVKAVKAFWVDLDVGNGPGKHTSREQALDTMLEFCAETELPVPMLVSSGNGIHAYWTLTHEIQPEEWRTVANRLKALLESYEVHFDRACTGDSARVLRPIGTHNRKNPQVPLAVELIADCADISVGVLRETIDRNLKDRGEPAPKERPSVLANALEAVNQAFEIKREFPPCSAGKVADRCAQVRQVRDTRGCVPEPLWYATVQLLCHSVEGDSIIHEWSSGYAGYSRTETDRKIAQIRGAGIGPTLCTTFQSRNLDGCKGCPFIGKIVSPVQLGAHVEAAPAPVVDQAVGAKTVKVTLPQPPDGFTRGAQGGIYFEDPDGVTTKVYEYDLFATELAYDEALEYETVRWRHYLPMDGWREFVIRSSLLARGVEFEVALRDHHVQPLVRNKMTHYCDGNVRRLRTEMKIRQLYRSMGWKNEGSSFVLGPYQYTAEGREHAGHSHASRHFLAPFRSKGDIDTWATLTSFLDTPGMEAHAFVLLLGFAAPLLHLAGRQGFTVCALGPTGVGKSTMAQFMSSIYSTPDGSWIGRNDTRLAHYQRMGAHCHLPVYMDEISTIKPEDLRDLIYSVPTGKSRASMKADYSLRSASEWATIFMTSSNDSLQAKLQLENANAEAESMRLFEFEFPRIDGFAEVAKLIYQTLADNHGVAGEMYIANLVQGREEIRTALINKIDAVEKEFGMDARERFWTVAAAVALYGGELAAEWGLIEFDPSRVRPWIETEIRRMRTTVNDNTLAPAAVLAEYLNQHVGERVVVNNINRDMATADYNKGIRAVSQRLEKDTGRLFVNRKSLRDEFARRHFNFNAVRDNLVKSGILVDAGIKKVLGAGTDLSGGQTVCWMVDINHPALTGVSR